MEEIKVLGWMVDRKGSSRESARHRLAVAEKRFWIEKQKFTFKDILLKVRFEEMYKVLVPSALHGCESWSWSGETVKIVRKWGQKMMRRILGLPRKNKLEEHLITWHRRCVACATKMMNSMGKELMLVRRLRRIHVVTNKIAQFDDLASDFFLEQIMATCNDVQRAKVLAKNDNRETL